MRGARRRVERDGTDMIRLAHMTAVFTRASKLNSDVRKYLPGARQAQSPEEMLAVLHELQARGAPMNIRKVEG